MLLNQSLFLERGEGLIIAKNTLKLGSHQKVAII
jgi:hypothetical protein